MSGVYAAVEGRDAIHVVPVDAFTIITAPLEAYRLPTTDPDAPRFLSPDDITTQRRADPEMAAPVWSPQQEMQSPQMMSPNAETPDWARPEMAPGIGEQEWGSQEMASPDWMAPAPPADQREMVSPE